jgi:hypothetical protein
MILFQVAVSIILQWVHLLDLTLSGNPRNPNYRPLSGAQENTSCSSESMLPESVESNPGYLNALQTAFLPDFNGKLKTLIR